MRYNQKSVGKKRRLSKVMGCLIAAITLLTGCFAGCGGNSVKNNPDTLRIWIYYGGYGVNWLKDDMVKLYQEKYPDQKVDVRIGYKQGDAVEELKSGSSTIDLYFARGDMFKYVLQPTNLFGTQYQTLIEDITDIYNETLPGETVTMKEKMDKSFSEYAGVEKGDGVHYYTAPWAIGQNGLIRNNKIWKEEWGTPRTTDELFTILDKIKSEGNYPIIFSLKEGQYWDAFYQIWFYQYEGYQNYLNFFNGIDSLGRENTPEVLLYDGKLESMKVISRILNPDNGYWDTARCGSVSFTNAQQYFLDGTFNNPLTCNGDWMNYELIDGGNKSSDIDIEMIKTPIISSLGTKLGITDNTLAEIVDYVDGKTSSVPEFASTEGYSDEEVIDKVREARGMNPTASSMHNMWIPIYARNKDAAKKFIQLMATDEAIETFVKATQGYLLPYNYDYSTLESVMSPYIKSTNDKIIASFKSQEDYERIVPLYMAKSRLFALGGLSVNGNNLNGSIIGRFCAINPNDRRTAEQIFEEDYNGVKSRWSSYLTVSGLN